MRFRFFLRFLAIVFALILAVLSARFYMQEKKAEEPTKVVSALTDPEPGTYIREGSSGELLLSRDTDDNLVFTLKADGIDGDTCSLDGVIQEGKAVLRKKSEEGGCIVTFTSRKNGVEVQAADGAVDNENGLCRSYCGLRASFSGLYLKQPSS